MTLTIDYVGNGLYGAFKAFQYDKPLRSFPTAEAAYFFSLSLAKGVVGPLGTGVVLVPPVIKEILRLK